MVFAGMFCLTATAESSTSFYHMEQPGGNQSTVLSREMYTAVEFITVSSLGLDGSLTELSDICFGGNGQIYLLYGSGSKIVVLNPDYSFIR